MSCFPNLGLTEKLLDVVPGCEGRPGRCSEVSLVRLISENRPVQNHLQGAKGGAQSDAREPFSLIFGFAASWRTCLV